MRKNEDSIASFKDAQQVVRNGPSKVLGQIVDLLVNKNIVGLGFFVNNGKGENMKSKSALGKYQDIFHSGDYLHPTVSRINAIMEDEEEQEMPSYVTHEVRVQNWVTIDVPSCIHISK